jgi:hypothetical protein
LPPGDYFASVLERAALHVLDVKLLTDDLLLLLLLTAIAGFGLVFVMLRLIAPASAHIYAAAIVSAALIVYWVWFDRALHAETRYYLRTVVLIGTPVLGMLAALRTLAAEGKLSPSAAFLLRFEAPLESPMATQAALGLVLLVLLVHAVETAKFVRAWSAYETAVRTLAMSSLSDPSLGDARFVSAERVTADRRLAWPSTTLFLSALLAPNFVPARLVVDPAGYYFWLTCARAEANEKAERAVPVETRRLIRVQACLHRQ